MRIRSWTDTDLLNAYANSRSISQILTTLGLVPAGGNYHQIRFHCERLGLDVDALSGQGWLKGLQVTTNPQRPLSDVLVINSRYQSSKLRLRLIDEGYFKNECSTCGNNATWLDNTLVLHLDHINGEHTDNRLENLRLLCPNCHSQTATYCGKNKNRVILAQLVEA